MAMGYVRDVELCGAGAWIHSTTYRGHLHVPTTIPIVATQFTSHDIAISYMLRSYHIFEMIHIDTQASPDHSKLSPKQPSQSYVACM
jgi:hypothetical protein